MMNNIQVKDINTIAFQLGGTVSFHSDSQDVIEFNEEHNEDYDSYFTIWKDCDLIKLYGTNGIIPHLQKEIFEVKIL